MKKILFTLIGSCLLSLTVFGQAKKPTLMVIPSDTWCNEMGYIKNFENQGETVTVPDYEKAFLQNSELKTAITALGNLMQSRGFPLKDMEQTIKSIAQSRAEDLARSSKSGAEIAETPLDQVLKRAKCDIIIELHWKVNKMGMKKSLTYNLKGLDAYTNKQIAGTTGTGEPSVTSELAVMIDESINGSIDQFNDKLMMYFTDMAEKGREIALSIKLWDDAEVDLEEELEEGALCDIIEDWVSANTVNGNFNLTDATETMMMFEQVRIPLFNEQGKAIDARRWGRGLSTKLKGMGIDNKITMKGLGQVGIIIGGK